jgi:hypothetical protein
LKAKIFSSASKNALAYYNAAVATVKSGANPTMASYNTSVVNFYNAAGSLARFENKNFSYSTLKNALAYYNVGVVDVN